MNATINEYLDKVIAYADLEEKEQENAKAEMKDHILKKVAELEQQGNDQADAVFKAINSFGNPVVVGYKMRPKWKLVDVRTKGTARGVVAVGPKAVGIFAFGGIAMGVVAVGGLAAGLLTFGGLGLAILFSFAGLSFAPIGVAYGGIALGMIAAGGIGIGAVAGGGGAVGLLVPDNAAGNAVSYFTEATAPEFLLFLQKKVAHPFFASLLNEILIGLMVGFYFISFWFQGREYKRLKRLNQGSDLFFAE